MLDVFGSLKSIIKRREVAVDNAVFKLHYILTTLVLVACSLANTAKQYIGNPINCIQNDKIPFIDTYCWIHSTYLMPEEFDSSVGHVVPHPGMANSRGAPNSELKYYAYYQWVCFVLFGQAVLFYVPKFLWRGWEGGLMKTVVAGLHIDLFHDEEKKKRKKVVIEYMLRHRTRHLMYAYHYFFCEFLCLINVIFQMYMMDKFLDGEFFSYGSKVFDWSETDQINRVDPMIYVFPRMTKCIFHQFGPSGDIQRHDALCIIPLNIINEKIYIFLWFWFYFLAALTTLVVLYRLVILLFPKVRARILHARCRLASRESVEAVLRRTNVGDWFVFYMMGKNIEPKIFEEIVSEMAKRIETNDSNNP